MHHEIPKDCRKYATSHWESIAAIESPFHLRTSGVDNSLVTKCKF